MSAWGLLVLAGLFEVGFTTMMKLSQGFTRPLYSVGFFVFAISSFLLLSRAVAQIPIGTAYAVWTGIGAFGTALLGILVFGEALTFARVFFLATLIVSIIGLKLFSTT